MKNLFRLLSLTWAGMLYLWLGQWVEPILSERAYHALMLWNLGVWSEVYYLHQECYPEKTDDFEKIVNVWSHFIERDAAYRAAHS